MRDVTRNVLQASDQDLEQLATLFRVLGDRTRLQILLSLAEGEKSVSKVCDELRLPQPTVSHHLALLRMNNVVGHRRHGKQVFYGIEGRVEVGDGDGGEISLFVQNLCVRIAMR